MLKSSRHRSCLKRISDLIVGEHGDGCSLAACSSLNGGGVRKRALPLYGLTHVRITSVYCRETAFKDCSHSPTARSNPASWAHCCN